MLLFFVFVFFPCVVLKRCDTPSDAGEMREGGGLRCRKPFVKDICIFFSHLRQDFVNGWSPVLGEAIHPHRVHACEKTRGSTLSIVLRRCGLVCLQCRRAIGLGHTIDANSHHFIFSITLLLFFFPSWRRSRVAREPLCLS